MILLFKEAFKYIFKIGHFIAVIQQRTCRGHFICIDCENIIKERKKNHQDKENMTVYSMNLRQSSCRKFITYVIVCIVSRQFPLQKLIISNLIVSYLILSYLMLSSALLCQIYVYIYLYIYEYMYVGNIWRALALWPNVLHKNKADFYTTKL